MWNVMFGRSVGVGGLGFGVERDEQASVGKMQQLINLHMRAVIGRKVATLFLSMTFATQPCPIGKSVFQSSSE